MLREQMSPNAIYIKKVGGEAMVTIDGIGIYFYNSAREAVEQGHGHADGTLRLLAPSVFDALANS